MKDFNGEEAERLLFHLYTGLPLLPAAEDGGRCAVLARFGSYEVRLTEFPPDNMPFLPLWVELYRESGRVLVDGCGFLRSRTPSRPCKSSWSGRSGCTTGADLCGAEATLPGGSRGRGTTCYRAWWWSSLGWPLAEVLTTPALHGREPKGQ